MSSRSLKGITICGSRFTLVKYCFIEIFKGVSKLIAAFLKSQLGNLP